MTFCILTCREGSFSSGIWKYTVGRNCDCVGGDCDHATAAIMPDARIVAGPISLFIGYLPELVAIIWCKDAHAQRLRCSCWPQRLRGRPGRLLQGTAEISRNAAKMIRWITPCSTVVRPVPSVSVLTNRVNTRSVS